MRGNRYSHIRVFVKSVAPHLGVEANKSVIATPQLFLAGLDNESRREYRLSQRRRGTKELQKDSGASRKVESGIGTAGGKPTMARVW